MSEETFISDGKLEAKVVGTNQNDKGWYIRLLLHPSDTDEVTKLRVGAVLDIRWREVLNVEVEPIVAEAPGAEVLRAASREAHKAMAPLREAVKPKKAFSDYPLSAQCAMRTDDEEFQKFLVVTVRGKLNWREWEGRTYAEVVRHLLGVKSRTELATNDEAANKWRKLSAEFEAWQTDQKYAGARR